MKILFVHGFMGSAMNWGRIETELQKAPGIQTQAVDLLGHASNHPNDLNPSVNAHDALVSDLETRVKSAGPLTAVGHSFGLRPLLLLGLKRPDLISHLIAEDSTPELRQGGYSFLKRILTDTPIPFSSRQDATTYFESTYGKTTLARFFVSNVKADKEGKYSWRFDKRFLDKLLEEAISSPLWNEWRDFPGRTSLIRGEKSEVFSDPSLIEKMRALRPPNDFEVIAIPSAGHWVHAEAPTEFVNAVLRLVRAGE